LAGNEEPGGNNFGGSESGGLDRDDGVRLMFGGGCHLSPTSQQVVNAQRNVIGSLNLNLQPH